MRCNRDSFNNHKKTYKSCRYIDPSDIDDKTDNELSITLSKNYNARARMCAQYGGDLYIFIYNCENSRVSLRSFQKLIS